MEALTPDDPAHIGPYQLLGRLGAGGMGLVYLARSEGGRTVAVKLVRQELADQDEFRRRFAQEVAAARRVGDGWTAPVLDTDTEAVTPWVATGYVPGRSLTDVIGTHGPLPGSSVRQLAGGLAHALHAIHSAGLVHRDLKPSNILLTVDGPRVIDFGIARALDTVTDGGRTRTGAVIGSPGFMSPEQVRGERVTPASDVFCLGTVLAYALTGRPPFGSAESGVHALMFRVAEGEPDLDGIPEAPDPRVASPGSSHQSLGTLIRACLRKDPAQRPSVADLLARTEGASFAAWLPGEILTELGRHSNSLLHLNGPRRETPEPPPAPPRTSRRTAVAAALSVTAVAVAVALVVTLVPDDGKDEDEGKGGSGGSSATSEGPGAADFAGVWQGEFKQGDTTELIGRITLTPGTGKGGRAATYLFVSEDVLCRAESTLISRTATTLVLEPARTTATEPSDASDGPCALPERQTLTSTGSGLTWASGPRTVALTAAPASRRPVPAAYLGRWLPKDAAKNPFTLTIEQGAVGNTVANYVAQRDNERCVAASTLVAVSDEGLLLGPQNVDASATNTTCDGSATHTVRIHQKPGGGTELTIRNADGGSGTMIRGD